MVVYFLNRLSDNLNAYSFPIKEGDICMLHEGDIVKTVFIDSEVEDDSIFRDFRFVDTKSLKGYHFPSTDSILCVPYGKGQAKGNKSLVMQLLSACTGEWLTDFLNDTLAILDGTLDYWDRTVLLRLTREEDIEIVFETPLTESSIVRTQKLIYIPDTVNFKLYFKKLDLFVGDYCFCHVDNGIVLVQVDREYDTVDNISDFRLIEIIEEPEILLPLGASILYDNASIKEDHFLSRFDSIVSQPESKSILFCALNELPLSEDEDVEDCLDEENAEDEDNIFSDNKHLYSFIHEIIVAFEKKMEPRSYSILKDLVMGVPKNEVAKKNNLTQERIRQLFKKILEEVKCILMSDAQDNELLRKENSQLKAQSQLYIEEITRLKSIVKDESLREAANQAVDVNIQIAELLNTPIQNLHLSLRAVNVLSVLGISAFAELPMIESAFTLLNVRSGGRKTVHEIETLISKFGLRFGMTYSEIVCTLMNEDISSILQQFQ